MDNPFTSSAVESPTALDVQRRMEMAKMLMQQGLAPDSGTQYAPGGVAIRKSPLEGLAKMLQVYMGRQNQDQADTMQRQIQQQGTADAMKFADALRAKPAAPTGDSFQTGANEMGDEAATVPQWQGPQAPDSNKAMAIALGSNNQMLQQLGGSLLGGMVPKAPKWTPIEQYNAQTGKKEKLLIDENNPTNRMPLGGQEATKMEVADGTVYDPYKVTPGQVMPKQFDRPASLKEYEYAKEQGYKGSYFQWDTERRKAGATSVQVSTDNLGLKPKDRFEMEGKLGDDYRAVTKPDQAILGSVSKIKELVKTGSPLKDQSAIYSFAKMLDPDGAVREADYAAIANSLGGVDRLKNIARKALTGEYLSPEQRKDMVSAASLFEKTASERIARANKQYSDQARRYNLDPAAFSVEPPPQAQPQPGKTYRYDSQGNPVP